MNRSSLLAVLVSLPLASCMPYWGRVYQAPPARCCVVDGVTGKAVSAATVRYVGYADASAVTGADGLCMLPPAYQTEFHLVMPGMALQIVPVVATHATAGTGYGFATHPLLDRWGTTAQVAVVVLPRPGEQDLAEVAYLQRLAAALDALQSSDTFRAQVAANPGAFEELATARFVGMEQLTEAQATQLQASLQRLRELAQPAAK